MHLKDKFEQLPIELIGEAPNQDIVSEAKEVLISLGFSSNEVINALQGLDLKKSTVEEVIKEALKRL